MDYEWFIQLAAVICGLWVLLVLSIYLNPRVKFRLRDLNGLALGLLVVLGTLGLVYHMGVSKHEPVSDFLKQLEKQDESRTPIADRYLKWRMELKDAR